MRRIDRLVAAWDRWLQTPAGIVCGWLWFAVILLACLLAFTGR